MKLKRLVINLILILNIILITFAMPTLAHEVKMEDKKIEKIVNLRMKNMSTISSLSKKIYKDINSKDFESLNKNLLELQHNALEFKNSFPEGSMGGKSKKIIWDEKDLFNEYADNFLKDINLLIEDNQSQNLEALNVSFGKMTSNCGTCHKKFKSK